MLGQFQKMLLEKKAWIVEKFLEELKAWIIQKCRAESLDDFKCEENNGRKQKELMEIKKSMF